MIIILDLSPTTFPFHLRGRKGLIGEIDNFFEFKLRIGPCTERLYAVLPAGVETNTPSEINFLISNLDPYMSGGWANRQAKENLFEPLVALDSEGNQIEIGLKLLDIEMYQENQQCFQLRLSFLTILGSKDLMNFQIYLILKNLKI